MTDMSDNAKKLLKHFQDSKIPQGDFEYSAKLEELFALFVLKTQLTLAPSYCRLKERESGAWTFINRFDDDVRRAGREFVPAAALVAWI